MKTMFLLTYNDAINSEESANRKHAINEGKYKLTSENFNSKKMENSKLLVEGCQEVKGSDYEDRYSPVENKSTLRLLLLKG